MIRGWLAERRRKQAERAAQRQRVIDLDIAAHPDESADVVRAFYSDIPVVAMCAAKVRLAHAEKRRREERLRQIIREELEAHAKQEQA